MSNSRNDNRRRRVVVDGSLQAQGQTDAATRFDRPKTRKQKYSSQVRQGRALVDLVPQRWLSVGFLLLGMVCTVATLNLIHWFAIHTTWPLTDSLRSILRMDFTPGLSQWILSVGYLACAGYCLLTYGLRQHRRDDYRGLYRVWLALAALALLASVNSVVDLETAVLGTLEKSIGWTWLAPATVAVCTVKLTLAALVLFRLIVEVRACRLAIWLGSLAAIGFAAHCWWQSPLGKPPVFAEIQCIGQNLSLVTTFFCLLTLVVNSRFVCQEARAWSRLAPSSKEATSSQSQRRTKTRKRSATAAKTSTSSTSAPAASSQSKLPPLAAKLDLGQRQSKSSNSSGASTADHTTSAGITVSGGAAKADPYDSQSHLSKAERKRLKKLRRQERRAA